jgi:hypothetical protein
MRRVGVKVCVVIAQEVGPLCQQIHQRGHDADWKDHRPIECPGFRISPCSFPQSLHSSARQVEHWLLRSREDSLPTTST